MKRRRHFFVVGQNKFLCGQEVRPGELPETNWRRVDCLQCQVLRYLRARKEYEKRKARELARSQRAMPLLEERHMQLPDSVKAILRRYVAKYPIPPCSGCPQEQLEQSRRQWTYGLVQQVVFERPGEGWGTKRADPGRPISKDTITMRSGSSLTSWDLILGSGTDAPTLNENAESMDTTGQTFVEVPGVDLIGGSKPGEIIIGPVDPTDRVGLILERLEQLEATLHSSMDTVTTKLSQLLEKADESQRRDQVVQELLFQRIVPKTDQAAHESLQAALRTLALVSAFASGDAKGAVKAWFGTVGIGLSSQSLVEHLKREQQG